MMAPAPAAALAVPCFLVTLVALADATLSMPVLKAAQGRRERAVSLADISSATRASAKENTKAKNPLPSAWFGDFSQAESTYSSEGLDAGTQNPEWAVKFGRDPSIEPAYPNTEVFNSDWFHESQSGGPKAAWQTNYPSLTSSIAGNRGNGENPWRQTPSGWVQDYRPMTNGNAGPSSADWFDNSVREVDGFGRAMHPGDGDGEQLIMWKERSVNTTLTCKEPGCTARSSLQLFNTATEEATRCSLSIVIHPTDYDDDWSHEHVEFWKVNGFIATRECNPRARGCNSTAERPLYPCLNAFNVDKVVNGAGTLVIEGKNSIMVDECPHENNLLSGVALATCMVRNKTAPPPVKKEAALFTMNDLHGKAKLKCNKPGCTAETMVYFSPAIALNGGKCTMNVSVHQTDFDDALGLPEQIDFIQVEGTNVTTAPLQPGKNPCNLGYKGTNATAADLIFAAVKSYDVTELVKKSHPLGALKVTGKISNQVDECGYDGNLLNGNVTVTCVPPANFSATPPASALALLHPPQVPDGNSSSAAEAPVVETPAAPVTPVLLQEKSVQKHRV
jgi:hypothetical protein